MKQKSAEAHRPSALTVSLSVSFEAMRVQAAHRHKGETGKVRETDRKRSSRDRARGKTASSQLHSQHT